ncbi:biliverdin-producing heme oxygenase [Antarcticirhabdus aurantiaca]|uniref:Biliverdin-producing heme oxygenase n=1 Tax=Antarcticirhabdus aurantiaca TaxID=2606717 RepID=A0ACD4NPT7_9HYPH|nr:biliverdin-producing heme oxygenase [Antarcticirhabdus aurantiaca]WAJ28837.1 biliverdin-producing heme oxygenase [Jeongeuplla avenae]
MPSAQTSIEAATDGRLTGPAALRAHLREGTRAAHEALDARFSGMTEEAGPESYRRFVAMNAAAFADLVPRLLASALAARPEAVAPLVASLAALEADRAAMDLDALGAPEASAPASAAPGLDEAVGIAYVLEGSKLGARYMHRRLLQRRAAELWPEASFRYLADADASAGFSAYLSVLAGADPDDLAAPARQDARLAGAEAAFRHFGAVLDRIDAGPAPAKGHCHGIAP